MKITHLKTFIAIIAMFMSLCGASIAQDERERQRRGADQRPPRGAPQGQDQAGTLFQALDRNRDGKLQQNEIDLAVVVLRRMDENEDGVDDVLYVDANENDIYEVKVLLPEGHHEYDYTLYILDDDEDETYDYIGHDYDNDQEIDEYEEIT